MNDFDPTDPWGSVSPWDVAGQTQTPSTQEAPVTNPTTAVANNPFKIGMTLKASSGYDAEWLTPTVYGATAEDTAQKAKDLLLAMKSNGLIDFVSQAAEYTRGQFKGGQKGTAPAGAKPSFQNGQVQYNQPPASAGQSRPDNVPSHYEYKEGTSKNGKPYKGWFPPRGVDGSPVWA